jgi:hypothetical protein
MDELFENRYTVTRERLLEWAQRPARRDFFLILWAAMLLFSAYECAVTTVAGDWLFAGIYLLLALFCAYRIFLRRQVQVNRMFKKLSDMQGTAQWQRVVVLGEEITVHDGSTTVRFQWRQVREVIVRDDALLLRVPGNLAVRIFPDSFTKGSEESFLQFLRARHASIPISVKKKK